MQGLPSSLLSAQAWLSSHVCGPRELTRARVNAACGARALVACRLVFKVSLSWTRTCRVRCGRTFLILLTPIIQVRPALLVLPYDPPFVRMCRHVRPVAFAELKRYGFPVRHIDEKRQEARIRRAKKPTTAGPTRHSDTHTRPAHRPTVGVAVPIASREPRSGGALHLRATRLLPRAPDGDAGAGEPAPVLASWSRPKPAAASA